LNPDRIQKTTGRSVWPT